MNLTLIVFFVVLLCGLLTGCDVGSSVNVDTGPIGSGLATIGIGIVMAAFVLTLLKGGDK